MSPQPSPPWTTGFQARRRGFNPGMRVSDAERSEVADRLSKHYSDGRLDQAEFDERLHRAMNAKTQADFVGLFDDLPDQPGTGQGADGTGTEPITPVIPRKRQRPGHPIERLILFAFIVIAAVVLGNTLVHSWLIWVLIGLLGFLWLRGYDRRRC